MTQEDNTAVQAGPANKRGLAIPAVVGIIGLLAGAGIGILSTHGSVSAVSAERDQAVAEYNKIMAATDAINAERDAARDSQKDALTRAQQAEDKLTEELVRIERREQAVIKREEAVGAVEARIKETSFDDGTWWVGRDIEPGMYTVKEEAGAGCYWALYKAGTNGEEFINGGGGKGRPTVSLSEGHEFSSTTCPDWVLVE